MRTLRRAAWLAAQLAVGGVALARARALGPGAALVFTHEPDLDEDGRDGQLGALLEALAREGVPLVEASYVPLRGAALLRQLRARRRPFLPHAGLLAAARLRAVLGQEREEARVTLARRLLDLVRPSVVLAIDESGSGQPLVRAARRLAIPVVGFQHGDFVRGDPTYDLGPGARTEPADLLGTWSPWFRARLLALSPIYDEARTAVLGRLRPAAPEPRPVPARERGPWTVLLLPRPDERAVLAPLVLALAARAAAGELRLRVRSHPATREEPWPGAPWERASGSLAAALAAADLAVGGASSALLEALHARRPALALGPAPAPGVPLPRAATAAEAAALAVELARRGWDAGWEARREEVWGGAPADPGAAALAAVASLARERSRMAGAMADPDRPRSGAAVSLARGQAPADPLPEEGRR